MKDYHRVKELFHSALERAPDQRAAFLAASCGVDNSLRAEVESMIVCHAQAGSFIEAPAFEVAAELLAKDESESIEGKRIGPYRIIREIGRGGMGAVYLAVRDDDQYSKQVAIKLIKRGMDTDFVVQRFRNERQILANLDHPHIARLLDGGATDDGVPYFVMEYIEGKPIDAYCDSNRLPTVERLKLFRRVCSAVQYAHQNLVIHRDIKPGNILITADGSPKLLDFGIAKLLNPELSAQIIDHAATVLRLMTPDYASPEQVKGARVTTASDVYSLGVLLYQLLTGHRPYRISNRPPDEIARVICEEEPDRPSQALSRARGGNSDRLAASPPDVRKVSDLPAKFPASLRRGSASEHPVEAQPLPKIQEGLGRKGRAFPHIGAAEPQKLARQLRGDLDNIVLMAMRKEPQRRYASVEQFSEDIRRHLEGLPVIARKDTFSYRSAKFIKRNKVAVAAAALVCLALLAGITATTWQTKVAAREAKLAAEQRDRAGIETAKAERINKFLQDMLSSADANWYSSGRGGKGEDTKVVDVLNQAAQRLETELNDQPEVKAELHRTIGTTYLAIGRNDSAVRQFQASLKIYRELYGEKHLKVAEALYYLASSISAADDKASAEPLYREALELQRALPGGDNVYLAHIVREYSDILSSKGDAARAEPLVLEAVELFRKHYGNDHITMAAAYVALGAMYEHRGELDKAEAEYQQALDVFNRSSGASSSNRIDILVRLGQVFGEKQNYQEAERLLSQALDLYRTSPAHNELSLGRVLRGFALISSLKNDYAGAEAQAKQSLEIVQRASSGKHLQSELAGSLENLGLILTNAGKPARAEPYLREAISIRRKTNPKGHPEIAYHAGILGECLTKQKRYREAEPLLVESYNDLKSSMGEQIPHTIAARQRLVKLYEAWGKPDLAARYRPSQ